MNQAINKLFTINPSTIKVAVILALLIMSLVAPGTAFAGPSPGDTGG